MIFDGLNLKNVVEEILNGYNHCKSKLGYGNLKIEEQRKYFEEHQQKFKEIIRKYNSGQICW